MAKSKRAALETGADLQDVVDTAEELLESIGDSGGQALEDLKDRARARLDSARQSLSDARAAARETAGEAMDQADTYVRGNPWAAVAMAGSLGLILGAVLSRRN